MKRRFFRYFTGALFLCCLCAIYFNVLVDDGPTRAQALETLRTTAGCGEKCKLDSFQGSRNILHMKLDYDVEGKGHWVVICRRDFIIVGPHTCKATGGGATSITPEKK